MIIFPAIDIKDGKCVRLRQGKADDKTIFFEDPMEAAKLWVDAGSKALHIVDLDGAFDGVSRNLDKIYDIKKDTGVFVQMGGGIRSKDMIDKILSRGIDRVILGSVALNDRDLVIWATQKYEDKIAVSLDALNNKVAYNGWTGVSEVDVTSLMKDLAYIGVKTFIYTDISKDGMMSGPDFEGTININRNTNIDVIASGGVTTIDDIKVLKEANIYGIIIGRALYNGTIDLKEALGVASCY